MWLIPYYSKDACYFLACEHKRISGRRLSPPKHVCVRRLAVPKRHNFCSSSSSLDTSSTYNHFLRLVDTIPRVPRRLPYTSKSFWAPSSNLGVFFQSSEILVSKGRALSITRHFPSFFSITTMSGLFVSPPSNLFEAWSPTVFTRPYKTRASQQILIWVALRDGNFLAVTMPYYLFSFSFLFLVVCVCVFFFRLWLPCQIKHFHISNAFRNKLSVSNRSVSFYWFIVAGMLPIVTYINIYAS